MESEQNNQNLTQVIANQSSLKQYWFFFSGQLFSLFGSSVVQFAIIWWLTITSKAKYPNQTGFILALASVAGFAPFVITGLFSGVLVDRWNRKLVIGVADGLQAFITGVLLIAFFINQATIPVVLVILAIRSVAQGFHQPASQAIIILMVPRHKLTSVNSYQYLLTGLINLIGPIIGAIAVEFVGTDHIATILWLDIVSFAVAIVPLVLIHIPDITKKKRESSEKTSFTTEFKEGVGFIVKAKGLLPLLLTFTFVNILTTPVFMLLPLVVVDESLLNGTAQMLGVIFAAMEAGSISGSFALTRKKIFTKNVKGVAIGQLFIYVSIVIMGTSALRGNLWGMLVGGFINGLSLPLANIHSQNIWQQVVPPELQGRVMSVRQAIAWLMIPVSQLIGGYLADIFGIVTLFYGSAIIGGITLLIAWYATSFQRVEAILGLDGPIPELYPITSESLSLESSAN